MMNSSPEQFHNHIDVVKRILQEEHISEESFQSFRESLENISKLYLEHKTDSNDCQFLQTFMKILTEYFQKDNNGVYKGDTQRRKRSYSAVNWLKNSYNIQRPTKNTEDVSVSKDRVGTTGLSEVDILVDQNSIGVSSPNIREEQMFTPAEDKDGQNKREIQTLTSAEDKDGMQVLPRGDPGNLHEAHGKNIDKLSKTNEIKNGNNEQIRTKPEHVTSTMHLIYVRNMEKEIEGLKTEIESKNQVIAIETKNVKELLKTVNIQSESHTAAECANKKELIEKNLEIGNLSKEITDMQRKNFAEINNGNMLQYKLSLSQQELQKQKDENNSLQSKLILKGDQLKKLELDVEIQKNIAVCENRQHQEKSKELQEFKTKSAELQNNLKARSDELISKLRELSECKSDLIRYADNNGSLRNQLTLLLKDYGDLESKLKINSTNYQKETTSLKDQLYSEKKASAELSRQFELVKEELQKHKDNYDKELLKIEFIKKFAILGDLVAKLVAVKNESSELIQIFEKAKIQERLSNDGKQQQVDSGKPNKIEASVKKAKQPENISLKEY